MILDIAGWVVVGLLVLSGLLSVAQVGKERRPLTGGVAAGIVLLDGLLILVIAGLILR